jgi:hypothetical protein
MFTPSLLRPRRVEGVLGVDEGRDAAFLLGVGDDGQRERGLARRLRAEDLDDAARGMPRPPSARSSERAPVEMPGIEVRRPRRAA